MNNPIIVPMCMSVSDVEFPMRISCNNETLEPGVASAFILNGRVTGVKGSAETDYRIGDVNLSPSDLGIDTSVYALKTELPTKTSDLTNDSHFVSDSHYVHTDENFTSALLTKLNSLKDLKILIDGVEYPIVRFMQGEFNGTPGLVLMYDDGSLDGDGIFIANYDTMLSFDSYVVDTYATKGEVPTKTSDLVNDSGFITTASIPSKTSDLVNDSGFIDGADVPSYETDPTVPGWAKSPSKPSYTASEVGAVPTSRKVNGKALSSNITLNASDVGALPSSTVIPTQTSDLTNDSGFITSADVPTKTSDLTNDSGFITSETDPTVPSWAKSAQKPTYTASEVGALPNTGEAILDGTSSVLNLKSAAATNSPILRFQRGTLTDNYNDWQIQDRGGELYFDQRGNGSTAWAQMVRFDTSGNIYANGFRGTLDWSYVGNKPTIPTQTSQLTNDSGFITSASLPTKTSDLTNDSGFLTSETDPTVPSWAKAPSKPTYTASEVGALPDTTVIPTVPTDVSDFVNDVPYAVANNDGASLSTMSIPYGNVDDTSTSTAYTATVPGITELKTGVIMMLHNGVVTSASGFTININGLGAKKSFNNMTLATADTTIFNINYTMVFVYNEDLDSGDGGWWCYRGYNSDTNTIGYTIRTNSSSLPMDSITYRYRILFTSMDGTKFIPSNNSTSTNATASRAVNQTPIDPFGRIVYYGTTASVAAGSRPSASYLYEQYVLTFGYSFNRTGAALVLTQWKPVWLKTAPQSDGSVIIDSTTPYVQDLPTTEDGKVYIYLGIAYSATQIEMTLQHPVKWYKDGAIRNWFPTDYLSALGRSF